MHSLKSLSTLSTLELKSANLWFPKTEILSRNIPYCCSSVSQSLSSTLPEFSSNVKTFLNHYWIQATQMADKRVRNWTFLEHFFEKLRKAGFAFHPDLHYLPLTWLTTICAFKFFACKAYIHSLVTHVNVVISDINFHQFVVTCLELI